MPIIDRPPDQGSTRRQHAQAAVDPDARQISDPEFEVGLKARKALRLGGNPRERGKPSI